MPENVAEICRLTWARMLQDIHADPLGDAVIAGTFAAVLPRSDTPRQPGGNGCPERSAPVGPGRADRLSAARIGLGLRNRRRLFVR